MPLITPFNISRYAPDDWEGYAFADRFHLIRRVLNDLDHDRYHLMQEGIMDELIIQRHAPAHAFMVAVMDKIDYSDALQCSVKQAGIAAAEGILKNPFIVKARNHWKDLSKSDFQQVARVAQRTMASTIKGLGSVWKPHDRDTTIIIDNQGYQLCFDGKERILAGSIVIKPVTEGDGTVKKTQQETITLNIHPNSNIECWMSWLGTLFHENVHAMEGLVRRTEGHNVATDDLSPDDVGLALADNLRPSALSIRSFETYRALPSERLARLGQSAFVQRLQAGI